MKIIFLLFVFVFISFSTKAEIKVGIMLGFSGPIETLTPDMRDGAKTAFLEASRSGKLIGGEKFKILQGDSTCVDSAAATAEAERLVNEGIVAMMGADCSGVTGAINANIAVVNNLLMISPSATSPGLSKVPDNGTFWRTAPSDERSTEILAQQTIKKDILTVSIAYVNNDYGKGVASIFENKFRELGGIVKESIKFQETGSQKKTLKKLEKKADALLVIGYADTGKEIIKEALKQKKFNKFILSDGMISDSLLSSLKNKLEGSFGVTSSNWSESKNRASSNEIAMNFDLNAPYAQESYDAAALISLAIQKTLYEKKVGKNYNLLRNNLSSNITKISNSPGKIIYPGELKYALELIANGKEVNYQGFTNVEFNTFGDTYGNFKEWIVSNNKFKIETLLAKGLDVDERNNNSKTEIAKLKNNENNNESNESKKNKQSNENTDQNLEVTSDNSPPEIIVNDTFQANEKMIALIEGKVFDSNKIVELTIDNEYVSLKDNFFSQKLYVMPEGQKVKIEAIDKFGNKSSLYVNLTRSQDNISKELFETLNPTLINVKNDQNNIAIIFGVENYENTFPAPFARNDALLFSDFVHTAFGVPKEKIKLLTNDDTKRTDFLKVLKKWLPKVVEQEKTNILFFYSGHGLASDDGKDLYLLPSDGDPELLEDSTLLRSKIFNNISELKPKSVTVFLDTCYSGTSRSDEALVAAKPIFIEVEEQDIPTNFTIFSASSGRQTAKVLKEAKHGLFSYYLMKGIEGKADLNSNGEITTEELHNYISANVSRIADQSPQLQGDTNKILVKW